MNGKSEISVDCGVVSIKDTSLVVDVVSELT